MRPTRSCCLTNWYLALTTSRVTSLGGAKRSLMTLKTKGKDGRVKTHITMPGMPGARVKASLE